ncbi:hypothetical protein [Anaerosporobacter sp.]|nr:hypothetical protein [Anaerosporobacter sp.]
MTDWNGTTSYEYDGGMREKQEQKLKIDNKDNGQEKILIMQIKWQIL